MTRLAYFRNASFTLCLPLWPTLQAGEQIGGKLFNHARGAGATSLFEVRTEGARAEENESLNRAIAYRRHARGCHALSRHAQNEHQRLQLLAMAETWESLAIEREAMLSFG